jgi:hypothetical protein
MVFNATFNNISVIPINLKLFGSMKSKCLNRIAEIGQGHICSREENLSFNNTYMI